MTRLRSLCRLNFKPSILSVGSPTETAKEAGTAAKAKALQLTSFEHVLSSDQEA